jgi:UDP:flavonoid glycosyltransferase YjiC (YdhE family)
VKKKILFIVEASTWSQVVRCLVLARGLDAHKYDVHFASASFDERMFGGTNFERWPIYSFPSETAVEWATGTVDVQTVPYTKAILEKYIAEELALYEAIHPDLVVQDMRFFSTPVSAPAFGVPCANLINAFYTYWIRRGSYRGFPLPEIRQLQWVNPTILEYVIPLAMPIGLRYFAGTLNKLRREHGLPKIRDLFHQMTWGDCVLFPDDPLLVPLKERAPNETFLGPILWSPQIPLPEYWDELGRDRPMVYATPGSSGGPSAVPTVIEALGSMDVDVVLSAAGYTVPKHLPPNVHVVDMIPGDLAARKAAVVVCNGGAGTGYQALAEGTPTVSTPSNADQVMAARFVRDVGAGVLLSNSSKVTAAEIRTAVERVTRDESFTQAAQRVAASFARFDPHARFRAVIDEVTEDGERDDQRYDL